jgi:hypothetical protein
MPCSGVPVHGYGNPLNSDLKSEPFFVLSVPLW